MEYRKNIYQQDFLILSYQNMGFIVNRGQFSGSTSLDNIKQIKSAKPFFSSLFYFNGEKILLFDYDSYLTQTFHCRSQSQSRLCILMNIKDFSPENRPIIGKLLEKNNSISSQFLGLIITSQSEIGRIGIDEIFLTPPCLRKELRSWGLYGCRFKPEDKIQYFIDFEITIINILRGKNP